MKMLLALVVLLQVSIALAQTDLIFPSREHFVFGVSNAPSQVEDNLDDIWMQFAREGKIPAFSNYHNPEDRIKFWSEPEKEIDFAHASGMEVFRLGIDWQRLYPQEGILDVKALEHYRYILKYIKSKNMKVMLTLFHHTEPFYTFKRGSWSKKSMIADFKIFWKTVIDELSDEIDYLVTFNEGQIYIMMSRIAGIWPHTKKPNGLGLFNGTLEKNLKNMAQAHREIWNYSKINNKKFKIGFAHNMANYQGIGLIGKIGEKVSWKKLNYKLADLVAPYLDFFGINYYGIERLKGLGVIYDPKVEYSDSGRGIDPQGFYKILKLVHQRYNIRKKNRAKIKTELPIIITENGIADEYDWFRPLYITEHLAAIHKAMQEGVKIEGYIQWSLTDNFEWADGYCSKFGLSAIDRQTMERLPRESLSIFSEIIKSRQVTKLQRDQYYNRIQSKIGQMRPMCRASDGKTALANPRFVPVQGTDWRFK